MFARKFNQDENFHPLSIRLCVKFVDELKIPEHYD